MVFFNYATMEMNAKIVYYGPGLCGKTTNLQQIYQVTNPATRGEMVSLATETDRTLFFDLLPIQLGTIGGFKTRFQLYTVPGQVFYNSTRKLVLKGVDAIVFVADSQKSMLEANIDSLENLQENLAELNMSLDEIPWVIQYNKRDLPNILSVEELNKHLNKAGVPYYEAIAIKGIGVIETLKGISKLALISLRKKTGEIEEEEEAKVAASKESDVEFDIEEDYLEEIKEEEELDEELGEDTIDLEENHPEEPEQETAVDEDLEDLEFEDEFEELENEEQKEISQVNSAKSEDEFEDEFEIDLEEEIASAKPQPPPAKPAPKEAAPPAIVVKDVTQKVVVPIFLKKDETLKDVNINLKLEIECRFIKGEPPKK